MKLFIMLVLSGILIGCSNNSTENAEKISRDTLTREPLMYRGFIEEGGEEYLDDHRIDADNMYYRGYRKE